MMTRKIAEYAKVCNVAELDMLKALQSDPFAREQFEAWKAEK